MKDKSLKIYYILFIIALLAFVVFIVSSFIISGSKEAPTSIKFINTELAIYTDDTLELKVSRVPENNYEIIYESDSPEIVSVSDKGIIQGLKIGTAKIKVSYKEFPEVKDECKIIVLAVQVPITGISLNKTSETLFIDHDITLVASISPADATNKRIKWTSSDPMVAKVTDGYVKALKKGETTITATSNNVISASCKITVVDEKDITATFVIQDKMATSSKDIKLNCKITRDNDHCDITTPDIKINNGYEIIGWSLNKNGLTETISSNKKITIRDNVTYYSITKTKEPIKASFVIQNDTATYDNKSIGCYLYNGSKSCRITLPKAEGKNGNTFLGWSSNKDGINDYHNGDIEINNNIKLYSITKKKIKVTYDPNNDGNGNLKVDKLAFTTNEHTQCDSYNGNGCFIFWIPATYSKGNVLQGFSNTKDGKCISIYQTKFTEDTILYAKVKNKLEGKTVPGYNVSYEELYGNIIVEIEYGVSSNISQQFTNFLKILYNDYPELFHFNGKVVLLTDSTYIKYNKDDSAGITWTDDNGFFSTIYVRYNEKEASGNRYLATLVHEMGHGYNNLYRQIMGKHISSQDDMISLYNKYKALPSSDRPLSDYAYNGAARRTEFFSEALLEVYRDLKLKDGQELYKSEKASYPVTNDIKEIIIKYLNNGHNYFKKVGRLS